MGRHSFLQKESFDKSREKLIQHLRIGIPIETACKRAGIAEATFYQWMRKGRENVDSIYVEFVKDVEHAEAEAMVVAANNVRLEMEREKDGLRGDVKTSQWYLERRDSKNWGKKSQIQVNINHSLLNNVITKLELLGHDPEQFFQRLLERLESEAEQLPETVIVTNGH